MTGIKHSTVKKDNAPPPEGTLYADDWNAEHIIDEGVRAWILIAIADVSGVTTYTFPTLLGNTHKLYKLLFIGQIDGVSTDVYIIIRPNNDSGDNYRNDEHYFEDNAGVFGHSGAYRSLTGLALCRNAWGLSGCRIHAEMLLGAVSGKRRTSHSISVFGSETLDRLANVQFGSMWKNSADNITSLVVTITGGNFTGRLTLLRPVIPT